MKRILVDVDRCSGCRLCEMVCSFSHEDMLGSFISRITVIKEDEFGLDLPIFVGTATRVIPWKTEEGYEIQF